MKILIAQMEHETNTFSPVETPWESFGPDGPYIGVHAYHAMKGTKTPIGAFIDIAEQENADIVTPVAGFAYPSGPVSAVAYDRFCELIIEGVRQGCDLIMLDLHGAMVVRDRTLDGEGTLLKKIREVAPTTPIAVSLDLHANVTSDMVRNANIIVGYKTYPHIDMYETGMRAGKLLLRLYRGEIEPVMHWNNIPLLAQTLKMNTSEGAMKDYADRAAHSERKPNVLASSAFGGFPMADIPDAGMSVVMITDNDHDLAKTECEAILSVAWEQKEAFIWRDEPLEDSIRHAKSLKEGPILLLDHPDNCATGATQDTMTTLREALKQGLSDIAVGPIRDPEAVGQLIEAGIGAMITLPIGGKTDMPAINKKGEPLELTGVIKNITDGNYVITGPQFTGVKASMGRTVVFDTGDAELVITEKLQEPWDRGVFTSVGIDPTTKKYLLLKSRMYFRPVFLPIAKHSVYCAGVGVGSSDWTMFNYEKIRRPIYPLDNLD
ncbi:MAG: M81 family metallopeptidase [Proteobacteria bacterium]|nr:M81 family metallopeptidase [Pseudomonadota bacterium]